MSAVSPRARSCCAPRCFRSRSSGQTAQAEDANYPNHPVRIIVPFAPGGPPDVIARLIGQKLSERWGQQVYVENHAGAGGNTGTVTAARAMPDGYTLYMMSTGFMVNPSLYVKDVGYDPIKDFVPVTLAATSPNVLFVNPSVPAKSVKELDRADQVEPRQVQLCAAIDGVDAASLRRASQAAIRARSRHRAVQRRLARGQFDARRPHADRLHGAAAGHRQHQGEEPARPRGDGGEALARAARRADHGRARHPRPGGGDHQGLFAPAGTPDDIVARINRDTIAALASSDVRDRLSALGSNRRPRPPAEFGRPHQTRDRQVGQSGACREHQDRVVTFPPLISGRAGWGSSPMLASLADPTRPRYRSATLPEAEEAMQAEPENMMMNARFGWAFVGGIAAALAVLAIRP